MSYVFYYRVTIDEQIIREADRSERISLAGMEANGTFVR
jgi:glucan phosphorylase